MVCEGTDLRNPRGTVPGAPAGCRRLICGGRLLGRLVPPTLLRSGRLFLWYWWICVLWSSPARRSSFAGAPSSRCGPTSQPFLLGWLGLLRGLGLLGCRRSLRGWRWRSCWHRRLGGPTVRIARGGLDRPPALLRRPWGASPRALRARSTEARSRPSCRVAPDGALLLVGDHFAPIHLASMTSWSAVRYSRRCTGPGQVTAIDSISDWPSPVPGRVP